MSLRTYAIFCNKQREPCAIVRGRNRRDALVNFLAEEDLPFATITQTQHGRSYIVEHGANTYRAYSTV